MIATPLAATNSHLKEKKYMHTHTQRGGEREREAHTDTLTRADEFFFTNLDPSTRDPHRHLTEFLQWFRRRYQRYITNLVQPSP